MTLTVIMPTIGRPTLPRALDSIRAAGFCAGDEVLLGIDAEGDAAAFAQAAWRRCGLSGRCLRIGTGAGDWGHSARNKMQRLATGEAIACLDDDDAFLPRAFDAVRAALSRRWVPHVFAVQFGDRLLLPQLQLGHVSTLGIVVPNVPERFGVWTESKDVRGGDFDFLAGTVGLWGGEVVMCNTPIAAVRPAQ